MLVIDIPAKELFNEATCEFIPVKAQKVTLEHSLISISKWEAKWQKPFLSKEKKSIEESIDYIRCMTLTPNVDPNVYYAITPEILNKVNAYIDSPMTATTFQTLDGKKGKSQTITSELIYYWMIALGIPFECQKWHLNRLLTLVKVCDIKSNPRKKMSKRDILARNQQMNAERRARLNSRG